MARRFDFHEKRDFMFNKRENEITGADAVDCLILLCLQESPDLFELGPEGAGTKGVCLARITTADAVFLDKGKGEAGSGK